MKKNIISIVLLTIAIVLSVSSIAFAAQAGGITIPKPSTTTELNGIGGTIIGLVQAVGTIVAVVMIIVVGIKYLTSSPEGKAQYKGTMVAYVVGAILIFAAVNIVSIIAKWSSNISGS